MNKVYVGNLSFNTTEQEIEELFGQYGKITEVALIRDRISNQLKGFGFITFDSQQEAEAALALNGKEFLGRPLKVNMAESKPRTGGGSGSGSGRSESGGRSCGGGGGGRRW